jgi:transcriptional antiterminator RfaH
MALQWYVLHSKPNKEDQAWQQVRSQGFETFYPRIQVTPVNPRARTIKPYFPGYLFVRADLEDVGISTFQWMPFVHGLLSFGEGPTAVPDTLIGTIKQQVQAIIQAGGELLYTLAPGDPIIIRSGPFAGYEGIFDMRLSGKDRVRVLLDLLQDRAVPVDLHVGYVEALQR